MPTNKRPRRQRAKPIVKLRKRAGTAVALHVDRGDGSQIVACDNLRVLITKQDGVWIAQGMEIDYAIDGDTIAEVKQRFQTGLAMTIESNLRVNGTIKDLLRVAPDDIWNEYFDAKNTLHRFNHSQVMIAQLQEYLPFDQILFVEAKDRVA